MRKKISSTKDIWKGFGFAFLAHAGFVLFLFVSELFHPAFGPCGPSSWVGALFLYAVYFWWLFQFFYLVPLYFGLRKRGWVKSFYGVLLGGIIPAGIDAWFWFGCKL